MAQIFFQCRHATHKEKHNYEGHSAAEFIISITANIISLMQWCILLCPQGTACWTSQRVPCHYRESCRAPSTVWTSSASRYLARSLSTAPTPLTARFAASYGVRRTGRLSVPPKMAAYPGLMALPVALMGPACTECACRHRRWCSRR